MTRSLSTDTRLERAGTPPERQPGDRETAPGELAFVQAFVNSRWDLENVHEERFSSPDALAEWLADRQLIDPGVRLRRAGLIRAIEIREGLRELMLVNNGAEPDPGAIERLNAALAGARVVPHLDALQPPVFHAARNLDGVFGMLASIVAVAQIEGRWERMKACHGDRCGWAFYDYSRNASGTWCSMSVCGSRAKAREYRKRRRSRDV